MHNYTGYTADQAYVQALSTLKDAPIQEGRGEPTKELLHVFCEITEPRNRLVSVRDINPAFAFVEVLWIMAGGNSVKYLEFWNKRMWDYADKDTGLLYGAYGHRLGNHWMWTSYIDMTSQFAEPVADSLYAGMDYDVPNQMARAYNSLSIKPSSRQIALQIWNSQTDLPLDGSELALDIPCNLLSHLLVRDGKLHWEQVMRSNDAVWGWPYNIIQWTFLQEIMAGWLDVKPGPFILCSDSFHTYKKHWGNTQPILDRYKQPVSPEFYTTRYGLPFDEWQRSFHLMIECAYALTKCPLGDEHDLVMSIFNVCDLRYMGLMGMLAAEAIRIKGNPTMAQKVAGNLMGSDPYWKAAWRRWAAAKELGIIL